MSVVSLVRIKEPIVDNNIWFEYYITSGEPDGSSEILLMVKRSEAVRDNILRGFKEHCNYIYKWETFYFEGSLNHMKYLFMELSS